MDGTLYYHKTIANAYIYEDTDGILWQVPMRPGGWDARKPYRSYRASLDPMPSVAQQRVLARSVGIAIQ